MSIIDRAVGGLVNWVNVNRQLQWYQLPSLPLQLANLAILREELRKHNLFHPPVHPAEPDVRFHPPGAPEAHTWGEPSDEVIRARTPDGSWNDLSDPPMGMTGYVFGRNVPLSMTVPDTKRMLDPNPRDISEKLLARDTFKPAGIINTIAAAWLQFENHNWFFHGRGNPADVIEVPLREGDDWPENPMRIRRTPPLPGQPPATGRAPCYFNEETHWWDGSQIYGSGEDKQKDIRTFTDGKLKTQDDIRLLPHKDIPGFEQTGMTENWWAGISMLHTLFTREHNAICDALTKAHPAFDDQRLFELAWLVNAALMAKIHTVEWTPNILRHPALQIGMNANWWGIQGEATQKSVGRASSSEALSGILGSSTDHHTAPFSLTEEFVSVYRMHPLIPDDWTFCSFEDGRQLAQKTFTEIQGKDTRSFMDSLTLPDQWYSFGVASAGAVCLHNYPNALRRFERHDGELTDMATLDIVRDRERGVPRYNDFREALRMPRIRAFEELTPNKQWAEEIRQMYKGDIDRVDSLVGMYAEQPPPGFGFSDTAFRIFILMASRRLKSDRFFTTHFTPDVYTKAGFDWVQNTTMKDVLLRHYPELGPRLENVHGARVFAPWPKVGEDDGSSGRTGVLGAAERVVSEIKSRTPLG